MTSYDINFESGLNSLRLTAKNEAEASRKAEKRNKYGESFTVTESKIDYTIAKEQAEAEAKKYGAALPKI